MSRRKATPPIIYIYEVSEIDAKLIRSELVKETEKCFFVRDAGPNMEGRKPRKVLKNEERVFVGDFERARQGLIDFHRAATLRIAEQARRRDLILSASFKVEDNFDQHGVACVPVKF